MVDIFFYKLGERTTSRRSVNIPPRLTPSKRLIFSTAKLNFFIKKIYTQEGGQTKTPKST